MTRKCFPILAMLFAACALCLVSCGDGNDEVTPADADAVDLGLSVKWATRNLGAGKPEEYGNYYGWGGTGTYAKGEDADWPMYWKKTGSTSLLFDDCGTSKDPLQEYVYPNQKSISATKWDAARRKLGGKWRIPTQGEMTELLNNCDWIWSTVNSVNGYKVVSRKDPSKYIFLPAAGFRNGTSLYNDGSDGRYWCALPHSIAPTFAYCMSINSDGRYVNEDLRCTGLTIRPVTE
ncbi:MAG: hypothetical protein HUK04_00185 [Bacteroidaceae bacterium]|nr:hypothetical protein [Bacteroidaceae bacterium]